MRRETIQSADDPRLAPFRDVADPARLKEQGLFVAEGRRTVAAVLARGAYDVVDVLLSESAAAVLADTLPEDVPVAVVSGPSILKELTGYRFHQGCLALVRLPEPTGLHDLPGILETGTRLIVGLEGVTDPDNVGTIFRSAAAFGADGVLLSQGCAHPYYRKALRTSMGAVLEMPFTQATIFPVALARLQAARYQVFATTPAPDATPLEDAIAALTRPMRVVLLLGSEEHGLDPSTLAQADVRVRIPLEEGADSLNVAAAAAIGLYRCAQGR